MRKILLAVLAMAFVAACQKQPQEEVAAERQDVAEAQKEGQEAVREEQQDVAEAQKQAQQEVREEQKDVGEAQQEAMKEAGQLATVSGSVTEADDDSITIKASDGSTMELDVDDKAQITMNGSPAEKDQLKNLQEGAQVRASYVTEGDNKKAQKIEISGAQPAD